VDSDDRMFVCLSNSAGGASAGTAAPATQYPLPVGWKMHINVYTTSIYNGESYDIPFAIDTAHMRLQQPGNTYAGSGHGYQGDATPPAFVLEVEDWTDYNWTDTVIKVTPNPDGSLLL